MKTEKLNILFYGAGVIGSIYGSVFCECDHRVTMLARGKRVEDLRKNGIVLENFNTRERKQIPVQVVETLHPEDIYDLIVVPMRKDQIETVLPIIGRNKTENVLIMANNCMGYQRWLESIGERRLLLGFPAACGALKNGIVHYFIMNGLYGMLQSTTFGEPDGTVSKRVKKIARIFTSAGFKTEICRNMDAWQRTHVALINPLVNAIYKNNGSNYELANKKEQVMIAIQAIREGFSVLKQLDFPITPNRLNAIKWIPLIFLTPLVRMLLNSSFSEIAMAEHSKNAVGEMAQLSDEFNYLVEETSLSTPAINELRQFIPIVG
jgi:2-dehydropantoate 2-reductase